ncbi:MAG: hypothetical protein RhofKO_10710 [Rhodothermales bacterium]
MRLPLCSHILLPLPTIVMKSCLFTAIFCLAAVGVARAASTIPIGDQAPTAHHVSDTHHTGEVWLRHLSIPESISLPDAATVDEEEALLALSKAKWQWMADKDVAALGDLFHEESQFVHMGGTWGKVRELDIIGSGGIWYKQADIHEASVRIIDKTAIVLNRITLLAEVGGNEVTNPFEVTEVYVRQEGAWKLAVLSFTRLMR